MVPSSQEEGVLRISSFGNARMWTKINPPPAKKNSIGCPTKAKNPCSKINLLPAPPQKVPCRILEPSRQEHSRHLRTSSVSSTLCRMTTSDCFEYAKNPHVNQNFPNQKTYRNRKFQPQKNRSSPSLEFRSTPPGTQLFKCLVRKNLCRCSVKFFKASFYFA